MCAAAIPPIGGPNVRSLRGGGAVWTLRVLRKKGGAVVAVVPIAVTSRPHRGRPENANAPNRHTASQSLKLAKNLLTDNHLLSDVQHFQIVVAGELPQAAKRFFLIEAKTPHEDPLGSFRDFAIFHRLAKMGRLCGHLQVLLKPVPGDSDGDFQVG